MDRIVLGNVAEKLASRAITGQKSDVDYMDMLQYYPENDPDEFTNTWCATFVYHCCREAGMNLPLGTNKTAAQKGKFRWFVSVVAWVEWAKVCGFWHEADGLAPSTGDIVVFNGIIPEGQKQADSLWCDHIGIVLSCQEDSLLVAEGNVDNLNVSGIVKRQRNETIGGYIRIPEDNLYDNWTTDLEGLSFRGMDNNPEDRAQLLEWLSNPTVVRLAWNEEAPWDMSKIQEHFFADLENEDGETRCFIELKGEPIGYVQYYPVTEDSYRFTPSVTFGLVDGGYGMDMLIGYPGLWSKGVGARTVGMIAEHLYDEKGVSLLCADPEASNVRSVSFWKKAGFEQVGSIPGYDEPEKPSLLMIRKREKGARH